MSRFNVVSKPEMVTNLAGGQAYSKSPELELASILLTHFGQDQYYRKADATFEQLKALIGRCDKKFVAQAIIYARDKFGMRTISHVGAAELAKHIGGNEWGCKFYDKVIVRPDDITEIISYYRAHCAETSTKAKKGKKAITNAMKAGFGTALGRFNGYKLAKYRGEGKGLKLVDIVNMVHPHPVDANKEALEALIKGELKSTGTWEAKLTAAGQEAETEEDKGTMKKEVWIALVRGKTLGYLALLRNLRNIMQQAPEVLDEALASLTNEGFIMSQRIFPFQYLTAYKQFLGMNTKEARIIGSALAKAVDISAQNLKTLKLSGNTLVAIDNSSSMNAPVSNSPHMHRSELGALFGLLFAKALNGDVMEFGSTARYMVWDPTANSMGLAANFYEQNRVGHGTNFHAIFEQADKKYDRILVFSDEQGWLGHRVPTTAQAAYKKKFEANPVIYSFDLAGYGTMQFPEEKTFCLAGFSDKIFHLMEKLEVDRNALINEIKKIEL